MPTFYFYFYFLNDIESLILLFYVDILGTHNLGSEEEGDGIMGRQLPNFTL
jgi:hypothetical protein